MFGGDGRGGFVVPEVLHDVDGIAAFVQLVGLVARTQLQLSEIDARIPRSHVRRRAVPTPWAAKGMVMRAVVEAAGDRCRWTPPTACASSSGTAAGCWCCPTRPSR